MRFTLQGWVKPAQADFFFFSKQVPSLVPEEVKTSRALPDTISLSVGCKKKKLSGGLLLRGSSPLRTSLAQTKSNMPRESNGKGEAGAFSPVQTTCSEDAETPQESLSLRSRTGHSHTNLPHLGRAGLTAQLWPLLWHCRPLVQAQPTHARHPRARAGERR